MCGIFGVALHKDTKISPQTIRKLLANLSFFSESRGKESAGLHVYLPKSREGWTLKGAIPGSKLLRTRAYQDVFTESFASVYGEDDSLHQSFVAIAHSRLVTNGDAELQRNNQPVGFGVVTIIHNGIVVNVDDLWEQNPDLHRTAEVDTEVAAAILDRSISKDLDPIKATRSLFSVIKGTASIAWLCQDNALLTLATNTGDLYVAYLPDGAGLIFASERYAITETLNKVDHALAINSRINWVQAGQGVCFDLESTVSPKHFLFTGDDLFPSEPILTDLNFVQHDVELDNLVNTGGKTFRHVSKVDEKLVRYGEKRVKSLRRCNCCVLPETFPFIEFDGSGVCNYCRNYKPRYAGMSPLESRKNFIESLTKYRRNGKEPDVLVPFSGGRDSSYGLHLIHEEFGLRPMTFTYDWGMVTDLARRNIARMCGQLGVQNILVSADIKTKRENIRRNVVAWLKKPDLGMVPLFMAGDKHFFRVVNQLKRQTGIALDLWCANPLENTDFKSGFCGVSPDFNKSRVDYLSAQRKAQMAAYYGCRFLTNPKYFNASLCDTFGAFLAYYFEPRRDFYFIFDHFVWDEDEVNKTLLSTYDWETSPDSSSTWRIGDGTAPFYNYIYMTARGFTEFDTFRSNQIREGVLTREQALESIVVENRPRLESLRWYLETIGLDFNDTIRRINELDTLGLHQ